MELTFYLHGSRRDWRPVFAIPLISKQSVFLSRFSGGACAAALVTAKFAAI
jgi:hypothetical protein